MSQPATKPTMADNFFLEAMKPAFHEDPYPFYERFRGSTPLLRVADTIWFALGHAEVTAMLRHPRLSTDEQQHATTKAGKAPDPNRARSLLFMDPPDHTRLRGLVARAFTPRRIEDLRTATEGITAELIDAMAAERGTVDLIEAFAYPLPVPRRSAMASISSLVMPSVAVRRSSMRRGVKARATRPRSRVWSGASMNRRLRTRLGSGSRPALVVACLTSSVERRGWRSMAVTSAWPRANQIVSATRSSGPVPRKRS